MSLTKRRNGRTLAEQTGWDVLLIYPATGQRTSRGSVALCTHDRLPGWQVGHKGSGWVIGGPLFVGEPVAWRYPTLWQAIQAGNNEISLRGGA